jgi:hypothetical protein
MKFIILCISIFFININANSSYTDKDIFSNISKQPHNDFIISKKINKKEISFFNYNTNKIEKAYITKVSIKLNNYAYKEFTYNIEQDKTSIIELSIYQKGYDFNQLINSFLINNSQRKKTFNYKNKTINFLILSIKE